MQGSPCGGGGREGVEKEAGTGTGWEGGGGGTGREGGRTCAARMRSWSLRASASEWTIEANVASSAAGTCGGGGW